MVGPLMKNHRVGSPHFSESEMTCNCGCGKNNADMKTIRMLNYARALAGFPFPVNSWCRCETHNANIGGVSNSSHLKGCAIDLNFPNDGKKMDALVALITAGFRRIGIYSWGLHVDIDSEKNPALWKG